MTELETLLLQQLEQQQRDSESLVSGLSTELGRLQTALNAQQVESQALRQEIDRSDRENAAALAQLTERVDACTRLLSGLGRKFGR
ncbi:hypothetical protein [Halomonas sp. ANAO-440]|uniref:hypothetical protein n=1 Tax=Halomonas sp. ANAO-440 TaxID=2861360 RepID=UPI0021CDA417|nr:hypothetical protein [Halomonas sp. ANAO-440]